MAKQTVGKLEKEHLELVEERARQVARLHELDARLDSGDASLKELRVAADELAEVRRFVEALDRRMVAVGQQLRELKEAERKARVAELHETEDAVFLEFCNAVDQFQDGPQQELLGIQKAIYDAGGFPQYRHRARGVVDAVTKFQRSELMHANMEARKRELQAMN